VGLAFPWRLDLDHDLPHRVAIVAELEGFTVSLRNQANPVQLCTSDADDDPRDERNPAAALSPLAFSARALAPDRRGAVGRDRRPHDRAAGPTRSGHQRIAAGGEQNPTSAYMTGKLKVKGDMGAAMKLQKLF